LIDLIGVKVTSGYSGGSVGALDYAELFSASEDVEKGDLVEIDPDNTETVRKTTGLYSPRLIGVVSTNPAAVIEGDQIVFVQSEYQHDPRKPAVALAGRVPVRVSGENGDITPGDPITSSSVPGVGMKAMKDGWIAGRALESVTFSSKDEVVTVILFVGAGWQPSFDSP